VTALEPRLYRAAFVPALVMLVVLMFAFEPRPRAAAQVLAADVLFDGGQAADSARELAAAHPDRRPGAAGNRALARELAATFARRGFQVRTDAFRAEGRDLVNVVGRRPGASRRQIVLLAERDAAGGRDVAGSAADTAALLELSRGLAGRATRSTIVLASLDGGTLGSAGARRFVRTAEDPDRIDAVLAVSHAGARGTGPPLVAWSNGASRGSLGLWRTAADSLRRERGDGPEGEHALGQVARLAAPLGVGPQGPLLDGGLETVRFSGTGELPPAPGAALDPERLGRIGRAVLRSLGALDSSPRLGHGPESYVTVARQIVPGSVLSLVALALLLPPLVAAVDGFARSHRRRLSPARRLPWVVAGALPVLAALVAAKVLALLGVGPELPGAAFAPVAAPLGTGALALLAAAVAAALAVAGGTLLGRAAGGPATPGLGAALAVAVAVLGLLTWAENPWTALVLAPAANAWVVAGLIGGRGRAHGPVLLAIGLVGPLGVGVYYLDRLALGPLEGLWYLFALAVGGHVGVPALVLAAAWLGALGWIVVLVVARVLGRDAVPVRRSPAGLRGASEPGRPVHGGPGALVRPVPRRALARREVTEARPWPRG
jgi:hypothetical protein